MLAKLITLIRWILTPFVALIVLFEEWGWNPLASLMRSLARLRVWAWLERQIKGLSPWQALLVFVVPVISLLPAKLIALWLIRHGQFVLGVAILLIAKLVGTALAAWLFQLTEPALMQFTWFAKWYPRWKAWKDTLLAQIRASVVWRSVRSIKTKIAITLRKWRARWTA